MKDLIQIKKSEIGVEKVNSANASEIHKYLGVKTHLSTWIKRAISKYDFKENIDFSILKSGNPNGGIEKVDYIVTLDMAKELAMLENNEKGKETRKYFISCEKKVLTQTQDLTPVLIEMQKTNQSIVKSNQEIVSHLTQMNEGLHEMLATIQNTKNEVAQIKSTVNFSYRHIKSLDRNVETLGYEVADELQKIRESLTAEQIDLIKKTITKKAEEIEERTGQSADAIRKTLFSYLNSSFGITTYTRLKPIDLIRALTFIKNAEINQGGAS